MNGEADDSRFVSMHVYMHLAFKELRNMQKSTQFSAMCGELKGNWGVLSLTDVTKT